MKNEKNCQNINCFFFSLPIKTFFNWSLNQCPKGEIIKSSGEPRHLSTILLKNFHLFKIAELVINFYLKKKFLTNNFIQVEVF